MKLFLSLFAFAFITTYAKAQQDTAYTYYDSTWKETGKTTAMYLSKFYPKEGKWKRLQYFTNNNQLRKEETFADKDRKVPLGTTTLYRNNGTVDNVSTYTDGKLSTIDFFYESGKKRGHITYGKNPSHQAWDEDGKLMPYYIIEREAVFPGGLAGWKNYLEQNLNAQVASKSKPGLYVVGVQFIVDKKGKVSNVRAIDVPEGCTRCAPEAVRIIKKGPDWIPAYQNNVPVTYQAIQKVTFWVGED
jgi:hypothetical protein